MDTDSVGGVWNSGEALAVTLVDNDMNLNSLSDEDLSISNADHIIPTVKIGSPITLADLSTTTPIQIFAPGVTGGAATMTIGQVDCSCARLRR